MQFITLTSSQGETTVNVAHIVTYRRLNESVTFVHLSNGAQLNVEETPNQISEMIERDIREEIDDKLDDIEAHMDELGAEFDRILADLDAKPDDED
jgi:hypothetical protein